MRSVNFHDSALGIYVNFVNKDVSIEFVLTISEVESTYAITLIFDFVWAHSLQILDMCVSVSLLGGSSFVWVYP